MLLKIKSYTKPGFKHKISIFLFEYSAANDSDRK